MCRAPHPKCRAVASVPALCAAPPNDGDDNGDAFSRSVSEDVASLPSPCAAPPNNDNGEDDAFSKSVVDVGLPRAEGLVIDIAGIAVGDCGC
jgi:hypothetical protein